jgi:hypothetical protein
MGRRDSRSSNLFKIAKVVETKNKPTKDIKLRLRTTKFVCKIPLIRNKMTESLRQT